MEITGQIKKIFNEQVVSDKFKKREFWLNHGDNPQYPQISSFECTQDHCALLDNFKHGQTVTVHFNLRGRLWTNPDGAEKCFNTLQAWKIEAEQAVKNESESDNLPF